FLAGLCNDVGRFIILTTEADAVMRPVHDRMPVCIPECRIQDWLADAAAARKMLHKPRVALRREMPAEQATLW
ncbi:MAG: SOS response-associated peptidase family protein, partial [Desulfovibrio sp.]|nr:SOS response-associated peptidase family protein [Desulfovibrio sp.]